MLDLRKAVASVSDYILIMSANSQTHMEALEWFLSDSLEEIGVNPVHKDGTRSEHWKVLDYGGLLVHIFHQEYRAFYSLERLWEEAKEIHWQKKNIKPKNKKR